MLRFINNQHILLTEVYGFVRTADFDNLVRYASNLERCARLLACLAGWGNPTEPSDGLTFVKVLDDARGNPCLAAASGCDDKAIARLGPLDRFLLVVSQIHSFRKFAPPAIPSVLTRGDCSSHTEGIAIGARQSRFSDCCCINRSR